jgi:YebC/PmpR family DNA-binding regulatory protein
MSGHSKWSTIKRKKGANDAKRAQLFSKLVKEVSAAARKGGSSPENNPRLRIAIQNARGSSVPKENIDRAIKKSEEKDATNYIDITYEGYAPNGVAVIVECVTDNLNRTISYVRAAFTKYGGSMAKTGSLSFLFDRKGVLEISKDQINDEDSFTLALIDAGADTIELEDDVYYVTCDISNFGNLQKKIDSIDISAQSSGLKYIPNTLVNIEECSSDAIEKLIDTLEDIDDVQHLYHNMEKI